MILIRTSWYLSVMFLLILLAASAICVAPGGEMMMRIGMGVLLVLSIFFGIVALILKKKLKHNPESKMFKSRVVVTAYICLAAILTIVFLFGVVG